MSFFHDAFIAPFKSPERAKFYLASIIGNLGSSGLGIALTYDFATSDPGILLAYLTPMTLISCIFILPMMLVTAANTKNRHFCPFLIVLQILSVIGAFLAPSFLEGYAAAFATGMFITFILSPFWMAFHILMVQLTSDDNRGNEVSVSGLGLSLGGIAGAIIGGLALYYDFIGAFIVLCGLTLVPATIVMMRLAPHDHSNYTSINLFRALAFRPRRTANTIMDGVFGCLSFILMPVWLMVLGMSGLGVGLVTALQLLLKVVISPMTGSFIKANKGHEVQLGSAINIAGWLPWLFTTSTWGLVWSFLFWGPGGHMYASGIQSRWYEERTYQNMAAREICLGIGRFTAILISLPLIYSNVQMFFYVALGLTIFKLAVSFWEAKGLRKAIAELQAQS